MVGKNVRHINLAALRCFLVNDFSDLGLGGSLVLGVVDRQCAVVEVVVAEDIPSQRVLAKVAEIATHPGDDVLDRAVALESQIG